MPDIYQPHQAEAKQTVEIDDGGGVSLFKKVTVPARWFATAQITRKEHVEPMLRREAEQLYFQQGWVLDRVEKVVPEDEQVIVNGVTYTAWSIYCFGHRSPLAIGSRDQLAGIKAAGTKDLLKILNPTKRKP